MTKEASLEIRSIKIDETRNCLLEETNYNDLKSKELGKEFKYLNYVKHLLILVSTVTGRVSTSTFAFLLALRVRQ